MNGLILTINLLGRYSGCVRHTETQTIELKTKKLGKDMIISKEILHSDRKRVPCYKKLTVSEEVVQFWQSDYVPSFSSPKEWRKMTREQRLRAHIDSFDEGYGVSYEIF